LGTSLESEIPLLSHDKIQASQFKNLLLHVVYYIIQEQTDRPMSVFLNQNYLGKQ